MAEKWRVESWIVQDQTFDFVSQAEVFLTAGSSAEGRVVVIAAGSAVTVRNRTATWIAPKTIHSTRPNNGSTVLTFRIPLRLGPRKAEPKRNAKRQHGGSVDFPKL